MRKREKLVLGVGINDADYPVTKNEVINGKSVQTWICPFYSRWRSMYERCYSPYYQTVGTTYIGCSVSNDWLYFSEFRSWMELQDWEGKVLDKDLLVRGNKVYGPDTCVFIDQKVNNFLTEKPNKNSDLPIGVTPYSKDRSRYKAQCGSDGKMQYLGIFNSSQEAHEAWLSFKLEQACFLAQDQSDIRVAKALIYYYENY